MVGKVPIGNETEQYWMRQKLNNAVVQLRDIEDYFRPRSNPRFARDYDGQRADVARSIYEQITADFYHGRINVPTTMQKIQACADYGCTICEA